MITIDNCLMYQVLDNPLDDHDYNISTYPQATWYSLKAVKRPCCPLPINLSIRESANLFLLCYQFLLVNVNLMQHIIISD